MKRAEHPRTPPQRIAFLKPCCSGDVVFATALLSAVRRAYPAAALDWFISDWSVDVLRGQPAVTRLIQTGPGANPARTPAGLLRLARMLRAGRYDLLLVPDRSPRYSFAALLSGIPARAGLDSAGRGFGYTIRAPIEPAARRQEAEIYLDVARALGLPTEGCWTHLEPGAAETARARAALARLGIGPDEPLIIAHPGGGANPGMALTSKRWPAETLAECLSRAAQRWNTSVILIGAAYDKDLTRAVVQSISADLPRVCDCAGVFSLSEIAALAALPQTRLYIGNDTGATHLAAAAGARVLAIFGPSDPERYAPFAPPERVAVVWRPVPLPALGVAAPPRREHPPFDWSRDGATADEALSAAERLLER